MWGCRATRFDQGSQFTSLAFSIVLRWEHIAINMEDWVAWRDAGCARFGSKHIADRAQVDLGGDAIRRPYRRTVADFESRSVARRDAREDQANRP